MLWRYKKLTLVPASESSDSIGPEAFRRNGPDHQVEMGPTLSLACTRLVRPLEVIITSHFPDAIGVLAQSRECGARDC